MDDVEDSYPEQIKRKSLKLPDVRSVNDTVIVMGKVSSFKTDDGIFYFSINPELMSFLF